MLFFCVANLCAEPFSNAKVTKANGSVIKGKNSIQTGPQSKVELDMLDGTVVRLGAHAKFSYAPGSREVKLDSGTMLFSSPKDAGGAVVQSGGIITSATGPVDFEVANVGGVVKVICLSGKPTVSFVSDPKIKDGLRPGQMQTILPGAVKLSRADVVNLKVLLETSTLMQMGALPSQSRLDSIAARQGASMPTKLPGGAENVIQSAAATRQVIAQQQAIQEQLAIGREIAAKQLEIQTQQQIAAQQAAAAQQLAIQQQKEAKIAAEAEAVRIQQQQQIANANIGNQGNQGKGPQGNQGQNPSSPPGQGNQGNKPNAPPGQQKK